MWIRDISDCLEFLGPDGCSIRELISPHNDGVACQYSLAYARVRPGQCTLPHVLSSSEVYVILQGSGRMCIDDEFGDVVQGNVIYIPPNAMQYIQNSGLQDLAFLCIVDPAWRADDDRLV